MLELITKLAVSLVGFAGGCSLALAVRLIVVDSPLQPRARPPAPPESSYPRRIRVVYSPPIVRYDVASRLGEALVYDRSMRALAAELKVEPRELRAGIHSEWQDVSPADVSIN